MQPAQEAPALPLTLAIGSVSDPLPDERLAPGKAMRIMLALAILAWLPFGLLYLLIR
jgi:hypothetical protein